MERSCCVSLPMGIRLNKQTSTFHLFSLSMPNQGWHEIGLLPFDPAAEQPLVRDEGWKLTFCILKSWHSCCTRFPVTRAYTKIKPQETKLIFHSSGTARRNSYNSKRWCSQLCWCVGLFLCRIYQTQPQFQRKLNTLNFCHEQDTNKQQWLNHGEKRSLIFSTVRYTVSQSNKSGRGFQQHEAKWKKTARIRPYETLEQDQQIQQLAMGQRQGE